MRLPGFLRDLIGAMTLHAYDIAKTQIRADAPETLRSIAETVAERIVGSVREALPDVEAVTDRIVNTAREDLRRDFERITLFGILFRSQADQSRRLDSVDATLGVLLTALLVLAPIAFDPDAQRGSAMTVRCRRSKFRTDRTGIGVRPLRRSRF